MWYDGFTHHFLSSREIKLVRYTNTMLHSYDNTMIKSSLNQVSTMIIIGLSDHIIDFISDMESCNIGSIDFKSKDIN